MFLLLPLGLVFLYLLLVMLLQVMVLPYHNQLFDILVDLVYLPFQVGCFLLYKLHLCYPLRHKVFVLELRGLKNLRLLVHHDRAAAVDAQDPAAGQDRDAVARELLGGVLGDALVVGVEDVVRALDDGDGDLVRQVRVQLRDVLPKEIVHLRRELHARGAAADDQNRAHLSSLLVRDAG